MESNEKQTMGRRIAALRRKKKMTQEQLAGKLGVTPQAVSKWENDLSCPDISILPQLAVELDISVDTLLGNEAELGSKSEESKERVISITEDEKKEGIKMSIRLNKTDKWNAVLMGVLLIGAGTLFLLKEMGIIFLNPELSFWGIIWPLLLLGLGICLMRENFNALTLGISLFALYEFLYNLGVLPVAWGITLNMIWPAALILIGLTGLQKAFFPKKASCKAEQEWKQHVSGKEQSDCIYEDGILNVTCRFTDMDYTPEGPFTGAHTQVNFGDCQLDLTQCESFAESSVLDASVSFGELLVIVPRFVQVKRGASSSFGECEVPSPQPGTTSVLEIRGSVSFGNITVRYPD